MRACQAPEGVRVLVVEDEVKLAGLIRRGLREEGLLADVAVKGEDALWMAQATAYDVIVLDVMLPGIDGFATCRRLREDDVRSPILMLTARDAVDDRIDGLDAGADDYLVKPVSPVEARARIRSGLRAVDAQRQLAERLAQLEAAMKRVSSLESLLPLCMYCRRINSAETWQSVEDYLWDQVDVKVSHGCCPDCLDKLTRQLGPG